VKTDLTEQINRLTQEKIDLQQVVNQTKNELMTAQKEKDKIVQQLQTTLAQLHAKLDERVFEILTTIIKKIFNFHS
jgi:predicted  nucleic acid-binding Zn-ribbon protein